MFGDTAPSVSGTAAYSSAYWFRGTPINVRGVFQGDVSVSKSTANGGDLAITTWVNVDQSNSTGDAMGADGHGFETTEVDFVLDYGQAIGDFAGNIGLISYNFPTTDANPTTEIYGSLGASMFGFDQALTIYYDFDEIEDYYLALAASRGFEMGEGLTLDLGLVLGLIGEDQALTYFGTKESGFSDLVVSATANYVVDELTTLFLSLNAVTVLDSTLENGLDTAGFEDGGFWVVFGSSWSL
jgi:hypothetical protein